MILTEEEIANINAQCDELHITRRPKPEELCGELSKARQELIKGLKERWTITDMESYKKHRCNACGFAILQRRIS